MVFLIILIVILFLSGVALHGYLYGIMSPPYNPEKMTLNYERIGNGQRKIVLLHGLTGSLKYWKQGQNYFPESYSLLLIDLLGFGDSPKPQSEYTIKQHVAAVEKVMRKEGFNLSNSIVIGHSLGAILSIALVAENPDLFEGIAVIGLPNYKGKKAIKNVFSKSSFWDSISVDSRYKFVCFFHPLYLTEFFRPKNIPKEIFNDVGKHTWISYYNTLDEVIINSDLKDLATKIKDKNILFIHGENDSAAPIDNIEELFPIFSNSKLVRLAEADHHIYLAEPEKVWSTIESFFDQKENLIENIQLNKTEG